MTIKFASKRKPFDCVITDDPPHTAERARWSDGHYADVCTRHMEIFRKNTAKTKASANPLWFLRGNKTKQETINP